ncbi:MAG: VOC family protein [Armatimonadota bacterium]
MPLSRSITPCLWFESEAEEAARFYTGIFPNSRIVSIVPYGEAGREIHGREPGSVMIVEFELDGQKFTALNGGPQFRFNEAVSFQIRCETQEEVDYYWERLTPGGDEQAQVCGWLKDRFGLSWQVTPVPVLEMLSDPTDERSQRAMNALFPMKKIDIEGIRKAYEGSE